MDSTSASPSVTAGKLDGHDWVQVSDRWILASPSAEVMAWIDKGNLGFHLSIGPRWRPFDYDDMRKLWEFSNQLYLSPEAVILGLELLYTDIVRARAEFEANYPRKEDRVEERDATERSQVGDVGFIRRMIASFGKS